MMILILELNFTAKFYVVHKQIKQQQIYPTKTIKCKNVLDENTILFTRKVLCLLPECKYEYFHSLQLEIWIVKSICEPSRT